MKKKQYLTELHIIVNLFVCILLIPCSMSAYKALNRFKFFEMSKVVESEDGNFAFPKITDYKEIIPLELTSCFIDSIIITDILLARDIWEARGDTWTEMIEDNRYIILNVNNLPRVYDEIISPEKSRLDSMLCSTLISENPNKINFTKQAKKFYKSARKVVDFDYSICNDSLVICIYKYKYGFDKKKSAIKRMGHLNFIHKYDCTENEWILSDITENKDYFPGIYRSDYLRESILDDLKTYLLTFYRYKRWLLAKFDPDENDTFSEVYRNTYINSSDFPTGVLENFTDSVYLLPREYYYFNSKDSRALNKTLFKDSKWVIQLEYKLNGDSLIVHFHNEGRFYNNREKSFHSSTSSLGYFVHRYDCKTHLWKRVSESIYVY